MSIANNSYFIPLVKGSSELLRIPLGLAKDLGNQESLNAIAITPDGHNYPVHLNLSNRTLIGLGPWQNTLKDNKIKSICLEVIKEYPLKFNVSFSEQGPPVSNTILPNEIKCPHEGLYLGGKLTPEFYELIRTNEPIAVDEKDLLQHVFICGATGAGKTVLGKCIIEEAARKGIPVIAIDLKGDISSMAILSAGDDPAELAPWVTPARNETRESAAAKVAERQKAKLKQWEITDNDFDTFEKNVVVNIFTPRSNDGFRLALSAFVEPPEELQDLKQRDPDSFESIIQFMAETFVSRLILTKKKAEKAKGYIYEIIKHFWDKNISLRGYDGIRQVLDEVRLGNAEIEHIGGMATAEYISEKDREEISSAINSLLIGAQKLWFQGYPLDIETFTNPDLYQGKTPITIINIKHLSFQDQAYVVGYVAYLIWFWMQHLAGVEIPRLILYIDEIGGAGSKEAFFPSVAVSPSKPALNLLLRQGRAYGVCCIFGTQSPGDIDYKALGQCGTWAVGQLRKKLERKKIEEGASIADLDFETAAQHIPSFETGQFVIKSPTINWTVFEERWLMHLHRVLSPADLSRLKSLYENDVINLLQETDSAKEQGRLVQAKEYLYSIIQNYRFSTHYTKAYLELAYILYNECDYTSAINKLNDLIKQRMEAEETGEAHFLLGKCKEQQGHFADAAKEFELVASSAAYDDIKNCALEHELYCKNLVIWPTLTVIDKIHWWIAGKKPDSNTLIRLEVRDNELLGIEYTLALKKGDFDIPEPIDYKLLIKEVEQASVLESRRSANQVKVQHWASEQAIKIRNYLNEEAFSNALNLSKKVALKLKDSGAIAPQSIIDIFEKCNKFGMKKSHKLKDKLIKIEARQFEFEIANLFHYKGYTSHATKATGDDGVDVFAANEQERVIIQCKRWTKPILRDTVDELIGVKTRHNADRAILATTSYFSEGAKRVALKGGIELWDFYRLQQEWRHIF